MLEETRAEATGAGTALEEDPEAELFSEAPGLGARVLPPMARRRPSRVRSTSDLREAVADAVARAAAQGPLMPRGPDDEVAEDEPEPPSSPPFGNSPAGPAAGEALANLTTTESSLPEEPEVLGQPDPSAAEAEAEAEAEVEDYDELARLAAEVAPADPASLEVPVETLTIGEVAEAESLEGFGDISELLEKAAPSPTPETSAATGSTLDLGTAADSVVPELEAELAPGQHEGETEPAEDAAWPFGERRSAARQARKPLPAALQEAVAFGAAKDLEASSQPSSGDQKSGERPKGGSGGGGSASVASTDHPETAKRPGLLRRYGSAIAIIVLFLAAAGAAGGIAAFRGPVTPPTAAEDQAAANSAVLSAAYFPAAWHVSHAANAAAYGLGAALVTPSIVRAWLSSHLGCASQLNAVTAALTPSVGNVTAVAYTQATTTNPLGGPWQIADAVAFHTNAAQVTTDLDRMRSVLARASTQRCVAQFWAAALRPDFPPGTSVTMTVSPHVFPELPGRPLGWALEMIGTATVGGSLLPLRCQITSFAAGRAQAYFIVSSRGAALPGNLADRLLSIFATRTARQASSGE